MFAHAGYTPKQMVDFINANWKPEQVDKLATHIKIVVTKRDDGSFTEEDFASVGSYAENVGIKVSDYYNESNSPFKPDPNAPPAWEWTGPCWLRQSRIAAPVRQVRLDHRAGDSHRLRISCARDGLWRV